MTIQNTLSSNEQALLRAIRSVASTGIKEPKSTNLEDQLTKNQLATNNAIETARAVAASKNFELDPEGTFMTAIANLHMGAASLLKFGDTSEHLSLYILGRRVTHQTTYAAMSIKRDLQKLEQQRVRSNVGTKITPRAGADAWALALTTTTPHATADELLAHQDGTEPEETPADSARDAVASADYVYAMLTDPMNSWGTTLTIAENNLVAYLQSVGATDYQPREFLHSYTSVKIGDEYHEALSYEHAEQLLAQKSESMADFRTAGKAAVAQARMKALRAL